MRIATSTLLVAGLVGGSTLFAAPAAVAAPATVTGCVKSAGQTPVSITIGFTDGVIVEGNSDMVANNSCFTWAGSVGESWVRAGRVAKKVVLKTPAGSTVVQDTDRVDFPTSDGESYTVTFFFTKK